MKKPERKVRKARPLKKKVDAKKNIEKKKQQRSSPNKEVAVVKAEDVKVEPKFTEAAEKLLQETAKKYNDLQIEFEDHEVKATKLRFMQGCLMRPLLRSEHGAGLVEEFARRNKVHPSLLYKWHKVAFELNYSSAEFNKKVELCRASGGTPTSRYFLGFIPKDDAEARGGEEQHKQELLGDVERGIESAQVAQEKYGDDAEVQGAVGALVDEREGIDILINAERAAPIRQKPRWECDLLRKYTSKQPSLVPGEGPVDPEHAVQKGRAGNNADDILLYPLARSIHDIKTAKGIPYIEETYGVDVREGIMDNLKGFIDFLLEVCAKENVNVQSHIDLL